MKKGSKNTYFGVWLRSMLYDTGMSVDELAERIGVAPSTVSGHMYGHRHPPLSTGRRYAEAFGVDQYDIFDLISLGVRDVFDRNKRAEFHEILSRINIQLSKND